MHFHHQQVYRHQVHRAKLQMLLEPAAYHAFGPLKDYLAKIEVNFPHKLFQTAEHRSSKFPADLHPPIERKENYATRLAALALPTAPNNKKRHETLQRFMLVNDSVTVAVEVPVFLTQEDIPLLPQPRIRPGLRERRYHRSHRLPADPQRAHSPPTLSERRFQYKTALMWSLFLFMGFS